MLSFGDLWNASTIWQKGGAIIAGAAFKTLIVGVLIGERPQGDALTPPEQIDTQIGSDTIQPGREIIAFIQAIPGNTGTHKYFLCHVVSIFHAAEQTINVAVYWAPELLIEQAQGISIIRRGCICRFFSCHAGMHTFSSPGYLSSRQGSHPSLSYGPF